MSETTKPTKKQVSDYLASRHAAKLPPPTPEEIRRELGWSMITPPRRTDEPAR